MMGRLSAAVLLTFLGAIDAIAQDINSKLRVYLDCRQCFGNFIREEVDLVEYLRDPSEADVHVIVTSSETGSDGVERTVALIGIGRFKGLDFRTRAISQSGDTEDTQRRRLATAITIGLLNYLSHEGVKGGLAVEVEQTAQPGPGAGVADPWNFWVFSVQGSISMSGEESSRELDLSGDVGADRITDEWKITIGAEIEYSREDFDLDEDEPLRAERNERDFDALVAKSLNDHLSIGGRTSMDSSSFDNIAIRTFIAPAIEYNLFPYSQYSRRQLRVGMPSAPTYAKYREKTLFSVRRIAWPSSRRPLRSISANRGDRCRRSSSTPRSSPTPRSTGFSSRGMSMSVSRAVFRCRSRARRAACAINSQ